MPRRRIVNQNRTNLDRLTARWRARHDLKREGDPFRQRANPGREALARRGFPYHEVSPAEYVAEHGADMAGFTYDEEAYADAELDAWIVEVGQLLREQREGVAEPADAKAASEPAEAKAASNPPESEPAAPKPARKPRAKPEAGPKPKAKAEGASSTDG